MEVCPVDFEIEPLSGKMMSRARMTLTFTHDYDIWVWSTDIKHQLGCYSILEIKMELVQKTLDARPEL